MVLKNYLYAVTILIAGLPGILFASSTYESNVETVRKATVFSWGWNGFPGHISKEEQAVREIIKFPNAKENFDLIYNDPSISNEAKLYSLCGLINISNKYLNASKVEKTSNDYISVLTGDVLTKKIFVAFSKSFIQRNGCLIR